MKQLICTFLIAIISGGISAQHCPWDADMVVVVDIRPDNSSGTVPNLYVEMLKANGDTVTNSIWDGTGWVDGPSVFWQNAKVTTDSSIWHINPKKYHFWFAKDHYILFCNYKMQGDDYKIRITDIDGKENGGHFRTMEVEIDKSDFYPLCTNFSNWHLGPEHGFVPGYRPVKVVLDRKKTLQFTH